MSGLAGEKVDTPHAKLLEVVSRNIPLPRVGTGQQDRMHREVKEERGGGH